MAQKTLLAQSSQLFYKVFSSILSPWLQREISKHSLFQQLCCCSTTVGALSEKLHNDQQVKNPHTQCFHIPMLTSERWFLEFVRFTASHHMAVCDLVHNRCLQKQIVMQLNRNVKSIDGHSSRHG